MSLEGELEALAYTYSTLCYVGLNWTRFTSVKGGGGGGPSGCKSWKMSAYVIERVMTVI